MGADTSIEWTVHSFNPWSGCQAVSPACDHCYAEAQAKRQPKTWGGWGPHAERKRTSESYWRQPLKWNSEARKAGTRPRVFCASMADVFDNAVPAEWRADLWALIAETPHLDWLLLTKRPQNIRPMMIAARRAVLRADVAEDHVTWPWPNVWLGTTVENQAEADRRIPHLLAVPAAKRFLSCEPLLGPVDLQACKAWRDCNIPEYGGPGHEFVSVLHGLDWIIAGGESGPHARPSHPDWFRSLRDQCQAARVPYFHKQNGEWVSVSEVEGAGPHHHFPDGATVRRVGKKAAGASLDGREWREVPESRAVGEERQG
ncbi:phage Gp37/Gp68 family protein [Roseomonas sp. HJA6]|uniref:Phage Gp37/Gp68 family protein n=1 Tax=Roseomonas alba TaxID=2846776 RepID=A0ABS7AFF5_9PROT|nr:phage Gp37/Gp68 family protein [Neoroseomonas alba]MBW6400025.1 phage Gp37/Gp68 family protein [Neoroseomonas alba]